VSAAAVTATSQCDGWGCPIRVYITLAGEEFPVPADFPNWASVGEYLTGAAFGRDAARVLCVSIINRDTEVF
jgi:hypothetical protein